MGIVLMGTPRIGRKAARKVAELDGIRRKQGANLVEGHWHHPEWLVVDCIIVLEGRFYVFCLN